MLVRVASSVLGAVAQLARAPALQAGGRGFDSHQLHSVRVRRRPQHDTIADGSVALVVTSPPYFAGKQYEEELEREGVPSSYLEYLEMLTDVFAECVRKLEPGGASRQRRQPRPQAVPQPVGRRHPHPRGRSRAAAAGRADLAEGRGASGSCAWGSFRSAANPVLRDITERVIIASKGRFDRARSVKQRRKRGGAAAREHAHHRGLHGAHARRLVDPARERPPRRAPGAVPGRAARAADPAVHLRGRPRARPVHGERVDARGRRPASGGATSATTSIPDYVEIARPGAFFDAIEMLSGDDLERLERYAKGGFTDDPQPGFWTTQDLASRTP
jgi:hypothetical protein